MQLALIGLVGCFSQLDGDKASDTSVETAEPDSAEPDSAENGGCDGQDADDDGYCADDCDDNDAAVHPDAAERCNEQDDDCDGDSDEGVGGTYYIAADGDGYGAAEPVVSCDAPDNAVDNGADCDDGDDTVHPGATDSGNGVDDDCDGDTDEDASETPVVTLSWSRDGVVVTISGSASGWDFGMAETGAGDVGWFGESCIPGDEPYGYADYDFDICHDLGKSGGTITHVSDINDADDGFTLFTDTIANAGNITYFLENQDDGSCYAWGDDAAYYGELGCSGL